MILKWSIFIYFPVAILGPWRVCLKWVQECCPKKWPLGLKLLCLLQCIFFEGYLRRGLLGAWASWNPQAWQVVRGKRWYVACLDISGRRALGPLRPSVQVGEKTWQGIENWSVGKKQPPKTSNLFLVFGAWLLAGLLTAYYRTQICSPRYQPLGCLPFRKQNASTFAGGSKRSKTDVVPETSGRGGWGPNARVQRSEGGDRHLNAPEFCGAAGKCWIIAREPVVWENQAPISTW